MNTLFDIPLRQKILLSLTILAGLFILLAYNTSIISQENLNGTIFFYGIGVPMYLLGMDTLLDLDKKNIFAIWATIALVFLIAYFMIKGNPDFTIRRSIKYHSYGINKFISDSWTTPLKVLPIFLIVYFVFNSIVKKKTGNYIVNTFRQSKWYNDAAGRKIYWYDILTTFTLLAIIIFVSLFKFKISNCDIEKLPTTVNLQKTGGRL